MFVSAALAVCGWVMNTDQTRSYYCAAPTGIELRFGFGTPQTIDWPQVKSVIPRCGYTENRNKQKSYQTESIDILLPSEKRLHISSGDISGVYNRISDLTANTPADFDLSQTKNCPPSWQKFFAAGAE